MTAIQPSTPSFKSALHAQCNNKYPLRNGYKEKRTKYGNIFTLSIGLRASGSYLLDVPTVPCESSSV